MIPSLAWAHSKPTCWTADLSDSRVVELDGVRARLISFAALKDGKSSPRDEAGDAAKDRADFETLSRLV